MKPIIGVMPLWDDEKESIWMLPGYLEGIERAGGVPVIFPLSTDEKEMARLVDLCDGFLFTGGQDVSPRLYHEKPIVGTVCCEKRDLMEKTVLEKAVAADKSILGICRGIQFINVFFGGTLYQDIPSQFSTATEHCQHAPYDVPVHEVEIVEDSALYKCLGVGKMSVNSYHHQAVKDLAPGLKAMAFSSDGLVEAVNKPDCRFLWAVQWHPEFCRKTDERAGKIFKAFVESVGF